VYCSPDALESVPAAQSTQLFDVVDPVALRQSIGQGPSSFWSLVRVIKYRQMYSLERRGS
jgi:hypothetical protein